MSVITEEKENNKVFLEVEELECKIEIATQILDRNIGFVTNCDNKTSIVLAAFGVLLAIILTNESLNEIFNMVEASNPVTTPLLGHRCRSSQEITGSPTPFSTSNHYLWICASASFSLSNPNIAA